MTSCKGQAAFGVDYAAVVNGDGDGNFDVTFPQGRVAMDGTAVIDFRASNDSSIINGKVYTKQEVLQSGDAEKIKALEACNAYMADKFEASAASGTYDIWIKAFVRERVTGIGFEAEKHLTNRVKSNAPSRAKEDNDPYPYIK
jgi:hypothetical protein